MSGFVAGSSAFPRIAANPTLMIVAMALRLADWLKGHYLRLWKVSQKRQAQEVLAKGVSV